MRQDLFSPDAVTAEVAAFNAAMAARMGEPPSLFDIGIEQARGGGFMPQPPPSPRSFDREIDNGLMLHVLPAPGVPRAVLLHIHGGGFMLGSSRHQDMALERIASAVGVTCVSVEYRLAPEHPYPAAWDDCEAAARWLLANAKAEFGASKLLIAGESAGAMLAVATLCRLRDSGEPQAFAGAALSFGVYDTAMTPSQRAATCGVLKARDIKRIAETYAPDASLHRTPDLAPLYGDLSGLPPALFTIGTLDAMLDDSMFMFCRWIAAGNVAQIALYPGADHGFIETPHPHARAANAGIDQFLALCLETP